MKLKKGFHLLTMVLVLAFGPAENRSFWFGSSKQALYGEELLFEGDDASIYLARNSSSNSVRIRAGAIKELFSRPLDGEGYFSEKEPESIPPRSHGLLVREPHCLRRLVEVGGSHPVEVYGLTVETSAESQMSFAWFIVLAFLAVSLTYAINDYSWECGPPRDLK